MSGLTALVIYLFLLIVTLIYRCISVVQTFVTGLLNSIGVPESDHLPILIVTAIVLFLIAWRLLGRAAIFLLIVIVLLVMVRTLYSPEHLFPGIAPQNYNTRV